MASPPQGPLARLARLGGLVGRVGTAYVGEAVRSLGRDAEERRRGFDRLSVENAEKVVATMGLLKGAAMKLGQGAALAAGALDLPDEVRSVLGRLHDDAEPIPFATVEAAIEADLGRPHGEVFATLDPLPLGTASLGQAHAATLRDGREVVVKVQHPGIDRTVDSDLFALRAILLGSRAMRRGKKEMDAIFEEVRERLHEELDYLHEAGNLVEFRARFAGDDRVRVPGVIPEASGPRVLTMERLYGVGIEELAATGTPAAKDRAARTLGELHHLEAFRFRALHADPHPGNYLFGPDGTVSLLDFGCVKRFEEHWIAAYANTALCAQRGDREGTVQNAGLAGVWYGGPKEAEDVLWEFCCVLAEPFQRGAFELGGSGDRVLDRLYDLKLRLMRYPDSIRAHQDLVYLHRSLGGIFVMMRRLRPVADWWPIVSPHLQHAVDVAAGRAIDEGA